MQLGRKKFSGKFYFQKLLDRKILAEIYHNTVTRYFKIYHKSILIYLLSIFYRTLNRTGEVNLTWQDCTVPKQPHFNFLRTLRRDDSDKNLIASAILLLSSSSQNSGWKGTSGGCVVQFFVETGPSITTYSNDLWFCPVESQKHSRGQFLPSLCAAQWWLLSSSSWTWTSWTCSSWSLPHNVSFGTAEETCALSFL